MQLYLQEGIRIFNPVNQDWIDRSAHYSVRMGVSVDDNKKKVNGEAGEICCCHQKATPRQEKELKQLKNRLNRIVGQLNGISRMLDENRYCGDILTQLAAAESALQSFGYVILQEHMETCVIEEIQKGNTAVVDEAVELMKKLK